MRGVCDLLRSLVYVAIKPGYNTWAVHVTMDVANLQCISLIIAVAIRNIKWVKCL